MIVLSSPENCIIFGRNGAVAGAGNVLNAHCFLPSLRSQEMKGWRRESEKGNGRAEGEFY